MRFRSLLVRGLSGLLTILVGSVACSSGDGGSNIERGGAPDANPSNPSNPTNSLPSTDPQGGGTQVVDLTGNDSGTGPSMSSSNPIDTCASNNVGAEPAPLDIYIMLDISKSMLDEASGGVSKWTAIQDAVSAFLMDPNSAGIGVGIQYFPLMKPGVPATCTATDECGDGGMCALNLCRAFGASVQDGLAICETDADCDLPTIVDYGACMAGSCELDAARSCSTEADCQDSITQNYGPCVPAGSCENDLDQICPDVGADCGFDVNANALGACIESTQGFCFHGTVCDPGGYAAPAVDIGVLPDAAAAIVASMQGQTPDGDTPTGPALRGAIQHAGEFAAANPGHTVVSVLATDGLPTECVTVDSFLGTVSEQALLDDVVYAANQGVMGNPAVPTFVIGVFGAVDLTAPQNLNRIAGAGGTQQAQIIDVGGDVAQQFLDALNSIRTSRLACEFQIPEPEGSDELDFFQVNVEYGNGTDNNQLRYVETPDRCPAEGGWYYDVVPGTGAGTPSKIQVCPSTCDTFQSFEGSVEVALGCETVVY